MLLPEAHFADIVNRVRGHSVGLAPNRYGNVGDELIKRGALKLFRQCGIRCRMLTNEEVAAGRCPDDVSLVAEPGGGNLGSRPGLSSPRRRKLLSRMPGPRIILPQSASDAAEDLSTFQTVYAREETTWKLLRAVHPDVRLAPDLALALDITPSTPVHDLGSFFRDDIERHGARGSDPVASVSTADEYLALAGSYRRVVTNRLHFAIAALLQGQSTVLKANSP